MAFLFRLEVDLFKQTSLAIVIALATNPSFSAPLMATSKDKENAVKSMAKPAYLRPESFIKKAEDSQGEHIYIVHFNDAPIALYTGGVPGLLATKQENSKLQLKSPEVRSYSNYLNNQHQQFLQAASAEIKNLRPLFTYKYAFNGMAIRVTQEQAAQLATLPYVLKIVKDRKYALDTDTGPELIGAPRVWSGEAQNSGIGNYGEGVVVGIIDSGINTDHASFADVSSDGYDHTNPLGANNYLGDCAGDFASLCNDKLIGVYSYSVITDTYTDTEVFPVGLPQNGEDYGGHGTHVAGTAIGNTLLNIPESLPEFDAEESDGLATGFVFPRISGVAPRANVISYQVCWGGRSDAGDTYGDCTGAAINQAIEDAIQDEVDVINYSISGGGQPWNSSTELAFLSARNAGIFVATSAGNSGPEAGSTRKHAPWYTAVAAAEHGRSISYTKQIGNFTGGSSGLQTLTGVSNSDGITAPIVYAGDFANPNDPGNDSAQCLQPFPAGTFDGQIVVCDRGEIARVQKAVNVRDGGAGGYVLANVVGGATNIVADQYVIPGIHIGSSQGTALRSWLSGGSNHAATITASSGQLVVNEARQDVLASFSSKGPNSSISTLSPTIGGPGVQIYAAYADQQFGHDGHEPSAGDYNYLSGTSMSSPHVAGAAALVKAVQPEWTPDNIRSALAMTASRSVKKEDGVTTADWFDSGSGRVQVDLAIEAGLVMEESAANYLNANPESGGDPRTLNIPSITDDDCVRTCSWTRTFTATKSGTWAVSAEEISSDIAISVSPASFSLDVGETQSVTTTIDVTQASSSSWRFGAINLEANGQPDLHLPVSVIPANGSIPELISTTAQRDADSLLIKNVETLAQSNFRATTFGFSKATKVGGDIVQDPTETEPFDDTTVGIDLYEFTVTADTQRVVARITESSAQDIDLYLVFDANDNDTPEESEVIASSLSSGAIENIDADLADLSSGRHWIVVQNYTASNQSDSDTYQLMYAVVDQEDTTISLSAVVPSSVGSGVPYDVRLNWDLGSSEVGDNYFGVMGFGTNANQSAVSRTAVNIVRGENDVQLDTNSPSINIGQATAFNIDILGTNSPENRNYDITLPIPNGFTLVPNSVQQGGAVSGDEVSWNITKRADEPEAETISFELIPSAGISDNDLSFAISSDVTNIQVAQSEESVLRTALQIDRPPVISIEGSDEANFSLFETQTLAITAVVDDPNGDQLTVTWEQISGPDAVLNAANTAVLNLIAPQVNEQETIVLQATVSDPQGNTASASATVIVNNNEAPSLTVTAPSSVVAGTSYTVSASTSDPEGDNVSVTIDGVAGSSLTRVAPNSARTLNIEVIASDGINDVSETISITVTAAPSTGGGNTGGSSGGGGGGSHSWISLLLIPLILWRRHTGIKRPK